MIKKLKKFFTKAIEIFMDEETVVRYSNMTEKEQKVFDKAMEKFDKAMDSFDEAMNEFDKTLKETFK
jgi:hypothetical protein